jgi:hypothetical protein
MISELVRGVRERADFELAARASPSSSPGSRKQRASQRASARGRFLGTGSWAEIAMEIGAGLGTVHRAGEKSNTPGL